MTAYYNEFDPRAAAWLRELIARNLIAPGDVDERSIRDVRASDLLGYTQCHFFAGIGVWSYALRNAGWPDDRPVWTGSCPCQPFSNAGARGGFDDERHLWPEFYRLICECDPDAIFGEQVASKDGLAWLDLVQSDLEDAGYACGAVDTCAAGVGAPHIRQRLYWVADALRTRRPEGWPIARDRSLAGIGGIGELANTDRWQRDGQSIIRGIERDGKDTGWPQGRGELEPCGEHSVMADAASARHLWENEDTEGKAWDETRLRVSGAIGGPERLGDSSSAGLSLCERAPLQREGWRNEGRAVEQSSGALAQLDDGQWAGPTNGQWRDADWLFCTDGKWRPVSPGTFPLAYGAPARVGRLRGYGNGLVAQAAQAFIEAYLES